MTLFYSIVSIRSQNQGLDLLQNLLPNVLFLASKENLFPQEILAVLNLLLSFEQVSLYSVQSRSIFRVLGFQLKLYQTEYSILGK